MKKAMKILSLSILTSAVLVSTFGNLSLSPDPKTNDSDDLIKQSKFDWRKQNPDILSPVRHQSKDICWAYSAIGVSEINILKNGLYAIPTSLDLSENGIAFLTRNRNSNSDPLGNTKFDTMENNDRWASNGYAIRAGYMLMQWNSLMNETPDFKQNNFDIPFRLEELIKINSYDKEAIKKYVVKNGAVGFGFSAGNVGIYYNSSIYQGSKYGHAATIIGWDDSIPKENFGNGTTQNGGWIVKNSWGDRVLEKGYMYISYDTPIGDLFSLNYVSKNKYDNNYYYDGHVVDNFNSKETKAISAFKAKTETSEYDEYLKAVNVGFEGKNVDITVKVYLNEYGSEINPQQYSNNNAKLVSTATKHFANGGLRVVELPEQVKLKKGQYFSIEASVKNNDNTAKLTFSDEGRSTLDLSYVQQNSKWVNSQKKFGGVARIKAFTQQIYNNNKEKIQENDFSFANISLNKGIHRLGTYNDIKPSVYINNNLLEESKDYEIKYKEILDKDKRFYSDDANAGYGIIEINGLGKYKNTKNNIFYTTIVGLYPPINNKVYTQQNHNNKDFIIKVHRDVKDTNEVNFGKGWVVSGNHKLDNNETLVELNYQGDDSDYYRRSSAYVKIVKDDNVQQEENQHQNLEINTSSNSSGEITEDTNSNSKDNLVDNQNSDSETNNTKNSKDQDNVSSNVDNKNKNESKEPQKDINNSPSQSRDSNTNKKTKNTQENSSASSSSSNIIEPNKNSKPKTQPNSLNNISKESPKNTDTNTKPTKPINNKNQSANNNTQNIKAIKKSKTNMYYFLLLIPAIAAIASTIAIYFRKKAKK
ncbi:hypothetical protein N8G13_00330 [Mycoplasma zalophi]|uniref:C1 family peptidase n=1 Tax=Mycoplasma zalophi TaxID=191287 RepID=UPI0021C68534|nr:C1 family peptidase [Mycoplasma zalophi]MCU4116916.1 hypothetical protein [Mycoplasma zalophi]